MKWIKNKIITFSNNIFIPVTNICRNDCYYCSFKENKKLNNGYLINKNDIIKLLELNKKYNFKEVLFTFGEYAEYDERYRLWINKLGYKTTVDYIYDMAKESLKRNLIPHINAGILSYKELKKLSYVCGSMGLMLESTNSKLAVHKKSPGKDPNKRIKVIENAGKLKIPFTTGILIGIGESKRDIIDSLNIISKLHKKYNHIQEVIIQNYVSQQNKNECTEYKVREPTIDNIIEVLKLAKKILPKDISIQIPPNLIDIEKLLKYGINDLGGISKITIDYINPNNKWPDIEILKKKLKPKGYILKERLTIYKKYIKKKWCNENILNIIKKYNYHYY